jgi:uncharacterized membrane protein
MSPRLAKMFGYAGSSLWFRPSRAAVVGLVLGMLLPMLDKEWPQVGAWLRSLALYTFVPSTPSGSREVLIAMVAALATILAVSFSMTMVMVQLAASQYTPRLLYRFMGDRFTQRSLGIYLGTVMFLLIVLGAVSSYEEESGHVPLPALTLTSSLLATLACLLHLPRFLHHAARSVEASTIIANVGRETIQALGEMRLETEAELGEERPGPAEEPGVLLSTETGYVQRVDEERLVAALPPGTHTVRIDARTGDFLFPDLPLVTFWPRAELSRRRELLVHAAFAVGRHRTTEQDVLFGVRQLVDMALKALSPAINDVTTALMVVNELGAVGRAVVRRGLVGQGWWSRRNGGVTVLVYGFGLEPFLQEAFREIPLAAASQPRINARVLEVLTQLANLEERKVLRELLVKYGSAIYEATRLGTLRAQDAELVEARWRELQRVAVRIADPTPAPIH